MCEETPKQIATAHIEAIQAVKISMQPSVADACNSTAAEHVPGLMVHLFRSPWDDPGRTHEGSLWTSQARLRPRSSK